MRRLLPLLPFFAACSEYDINGKEEANPGAEETGGEPCSPGEPGCGETAEPEPEPEDTAEPINPSDCEVEGSLAHDVPILESCTGSTATDVPDPYNLAIEHQYLIGSYGPVVKPSVMNLTDDNADGMVNDLDMPDLAFTLYIDNQLVVASGDGSGVHYTLSNWYGAGDVATADVNNDGRPDICGFNASMRVQCVNGDGSLLWTASGTTGNYYPHITICDLDQDGLPEVIGDNQVVNGEDGSTAFILPGTYSYTVPTCADIDQDGTSEIIFGNAVYNHLGSVEWYMSATGLSMMSAVINVDSDPEAEVFVASDAMYLHDHDGGIISISPLPTQNPGPPCAADFDGDGEVEVAVPSSTTFYMFETDGTLLWSAAMQDFSGLAGCSGYDMDGDEVYEVLFADEVAVRLYDGRTGAVLYQSFVHNSGTLFEYPVVADVDNDGSAEIVIAENLGALLGVTTYGHAGDGWPAAGPAWPVHDYAITNIDADGGVPTHPEASWNKFNVFRARPAVDDPALVDLTGRFVDLCTADCEDGPLKITFEVSNQGGLDLEAGTPWAFYKVDGGMRSLITTGVLPAIPAGMALDSIEVVLAPNDMGDGGFVVVLDDAGTGLDGTGECDTTNNEIAYSDAICG